MEWFLLAVLLIGLFWQLFKGKSSHRLHWEDNFGLYLDHYQRQKWNSKRKSRNLPLAKK